MAAQMSSNVGRASGSGAHASGNSATSAGGAARSSQGFRAGRWCFSATDTAKKGTFCPNSSKGDPCHASSCHSTIAKE